MKFENLSANHVEIPLINVNQLLNIYENLPIPSSAPVFCWLYELSNNGTAALRNKEIKLIDLKKNL